MNDELPLTEFNVTFFYAPDGTICGCQSTPRPRPRRRLALFPGHYYQRDGGRWMRLSPFEYAAMQIVLCAGERLMRVE